ncbi:MAG: hypothetical protein AAGI11_06470 [Pseudomonadota bacterium]
MERPGLFDYPSFFLDLIQFPASALLPDWLSIALWALGVSSLSMYMYGRLSQQDVLAELGPSRDDARQRLAAYDGPFAGLPPLIRENLSLSRQHLWLTFVPALLSGLPVIVVLVWMSNAFGAFSPAAATPVSVVVKSYTPYELHWRPAAAARRISATHWVLLWPEDGEKLTLLSGSGDQLLQLPTPRPTVILHPRLWWNDLIANPGGYLEPGNNLIEVRLGVPERQIVPIGPSWMRGWFPYFLALLVAFSLMFKRIWRLH